MPMIQTPDKNTASLHSWVASYSRKRLYMPLHYER